MPDDFSCIHVGVWLDAVARFDVHIENSPAGLFVPIVIEVLDDSAVLCPDNKAIGDGHNPCVAGYAAQGLTGRSKIERGPARAGVPATMWAAGERPCGPIL